MIKAFYSFTFTLIYFLGLAQTNTWSLQQCIDYGQKNNLTLKQAEITTQINRNNANQSQASVLPTLNGGANHTYNFGRTIDRYTNTFANSQVLSQNFYLSSNVVLWSGMAQYNNIKANQYQFLSSAENLMQQKNDLALNIATAYINVIFSNEILDISKNQYNITKQQSERTQQLVDAGSLAKSNIYDIQAQLANEEVNVTTADNNYQIAMLTLKQLINLDSLPNFTIDKPQVDVTDGDLSKLTVQTIYETALKNQHSIKAANYNVEASKKSLEVAKGKFSPTLSATGTVGTGTSALDKNITGTSITGFNPVAATLDGSVVVYQPSYSIQTEKKPFADQFKDNVNKSFGFTLSVPIFNGLQTYTGYKNAQLNALNTKYGKDLVEQNLYKTIAQAYANARAAYNKFNANKLSVSANELSFDAAEKKYNVGALSTFDYNNAKTRLQNAQSNLIQAKYDYVFKLKVLDYYQGKPIIF